MTRGKLDPFPPNIFLDSNAFEHSDKAQIDRLHALATEEKITLIVPKGVRVETMHPKTPDWVRQMMAAQISTEEVERNCDEKRRLARVGAILQGNAMEGKHSADAEHLFEAAKYGGKYFITHDARLLRQKKSELEKILPHVPNIVTLDEFLRIYDEFSAKD